MDALQALRHMVNMSGKSARSVAREMDIAETFINMTLSRKSIPKVDTFADIADICGYELALIGHDEVIPVRGKRYSDEMIG